VHCAGAACVVGLLLIAMGWHRSPVAPWIAMLFLGQSLVQLMLNVLQSRRAVSGAAGPLVVLYGLVSALGVASIVLAGGGGDAVVGEVLTRWANHGFVLLLLGELGCAAWIARRHLRGPTRPSLAQAYADYFPAALPMATVALLALINTRVDAIVTSAVLGLEQAGRYMYVMRWADAAPMLAAGVALPLVGKIQTMSSRPWHDRRLLVATAAMALIPFMVVPLVQLLQPSMRVDGAMPWLVAATSAVRVGLTMTTTLLLACWRDGALSRIALATSVSITVLTWLFGQRAGAAGVASAVLLVETVNLAVQARLVAHAWPRRTKVPSTPMDPLDNRSDG
jgi:O-antigen/teichoic acid export membrane protein